MQNARWLLIAIAALSGCAGHVFTDENNRQAVQVDVGTTLTISLHRDIGWNEMPTVQGGILVLTGSRKPTSGIVEFDFEARGQGETEIKIPPDYSLRVKVVSASDRPSMPVHTH